MTTTKEPWQSGPTELIQHAIEHLHRQTDFDRRVGFLLLDVGVETLFKTFLTLPDSITGTKMRFDKRKKAANGDFHDLVEALGAAARERLNGIKLARVEFYHDSRNKLYHDGNGITVPANSIQEYAELTVLLLKRLLGIDLTPVLLKPQVEEQERIAKEAQALEEKQQIQQQIEAVRKAHDRLSSVIKLAIEKVNPALALPSFERKFEDIVNQSLIRRPEDGESELFDFDESKFRTNLASEIGFLLSDPKVIDKIDVDPSATTFLLSLLSNVISGDDGYQWTFRFNMSNSYPYNEEGLHSDFIYDNEGNQVGIHVPTQSEIIGFGKEWVVELNRIHDIIYQWSSSH